MLITIKSGCNATTTDYIFFKKKAMSTIRDVRVISSEKTVSNV